MYTNTKATVYRLIGGKYERIFLPHVFWDMKSTASTGKNGKTESDTVTVFLPLLLRLTPQKDLIIKDSVPLTIDNSTEEAQGASVKSFLPGMMSTRSWLAGCAIMARRKCATPSLM